MAGPGVGDLSPAGDAGPGVGDFSFPFGDMASGAGGDCALLGGELIVADGLGALSKELKKLVCRGQPKSMLGVPAAQYLP